MIHMLQDLFWAFAYPVPRNKTRNKTRNSTRIASRNEKPPSLDDPDLEGMFGYYTPHGPTPAGAEGYRLY
ncbi:hypothetical protein OE810_00725 [Rhodobacteraceae bacterium XHP0102]|nr:hypothetical protein [Rhodobacteraceae bacterium XHP0102]